MTKFLNFDTVLFIKEVKKRPAIWDTSVDHRKDLKRKAWEEIHDVFSEENMSQSDKHLLACRLQQRWKNLRTCFAREIKRQRNYGAGTGRKSEYVYYKNLQFLTNVMNIAEKETNKLEYVSFHDDTTSHSQASDDNFQSDQSHTPEKSYTYKTKSKRKSYEYGDAYSDEDEDEDRLFLLSLHKTLKRVPRNKKMAVKIKMLSILNDIVS